MKWLLVIMLLIGAAASAAVTVRGKIGGDKPSPKKKAHSIKPTKHPKSIVDAFVGLPADDLEFIKNVDKQFQLHGDKLKFSVLRDNTTAKNLKRTIEGDLGYGYHQNVDNNGGYYFTKPKFVYYPYSQQDIPATQYQHRPAHNQQHYRPNPTHYHTSVQIVPSQGFELRDVSSGYENSYASHAGLGGAGRDHIYYQQQQQQQQQQQHQQQHQPQQHQQDASPVIVLKIPGPAKYASHLQALLQQYLEIRAAQYIKALEEQENQQYASIGQAAYDQPHSHYHVHTTYESPQPSQPLFESHDIEVPARKPQTAAPALHYQHQQVSQPNYHYEQTHQHPVNEPEPEEPHTQYVYESDYGSEVGGGAHQTSHGGDGGGAALPTVENFPSPRHTQVLFRNQYKHATTEADENQPPPQVYHRQPHHEQHDSSSGDYAPYQQSVEESDQSGGQQYLTQEERAEAEAGVVPITPKSHVMPYNYHAHKSPPSASTLAPVSLRHSGAASVSSAPYSEEQFRKYNRLINRLKRKNTTSPKDNISSGSSMSTSSSSSSSISV